MMARRFAAKVGSSLCALPWTTNLVGPGELDRCEDFVTLAEPPSPGRTRSPSPAPAPPSPLLLLPPELLLHTFSALGVRDLSRAARACSGWRDLARPLLDVFEAEFVASEVACVVERLVDAIESGWWPPRPGMQLADSDEDDDYDYWYDDGHDAGDLNGECIACDAVGVAGGQCLSCGAPVEPASRTCGAVE